MKIVDIDKSLSSNARIALITDPPISEDVFNEIERRTKNPTPLESPTPLLTSLNLEMINGRLIVNARDFTEHIRHNIQTLLDECEKVGNLAKEERERKSENENKAYQDAKQKLINETISVLKNKPG